MITGGRVMEVMELLNTGCGTECSGYLPGSRYAFFLQDRRTYHLPGRRKIMPDEMDR